MEKAPTLKELLNSREENHANYIIVSTNKNRDLFKGNVSKLSEDLLNTQILAWDKKDGIYITFERNIKNNMKR